MVMCFFLGQIWDGHMFTLQTSTNYYIFMCHYTVRLSSNFSWRFLRIFLNLFLVLLVHFMNFWSFLNISPVLEFLFSPPNYPELFSLSCLEKASNIKISGTKWKVFTLSLYKIAKTNIFLRIQSLTSPRWYLLVRQVGLVLLRAALICNLTSATEKFVHR